MHRLINILNDYFYGGESIFNIGIVKSKYTCKDKVDLSECNFESVQEYIDSIEDFISKFNREKLILII